MTKCTFGLTLSVWPPLGQYFGVFFYRFVDQNVEKSCSCISTPLSTIMQYLEARAGKSEPGRAKRRVKWRPAGQIRGSGAKSFADRFCLAVGAMEPSANQPEPKSDRRSKSMYPVSHVIRSSICTPRSYQHMLGAWFYF